MRRPPEFIEVTEANGDAMAARARREPFICNGLMYAAGGLDGDQLMRGDTVAFPWPDAITELGQLAGDAERELRGEPLPAWPISRLRLQPGDIVLVKCGVDGVDPSQVAGYLDKCKAVFREALDGAGYGKEVQTVFMSANIEVSVIAASADRKGS